MNHSLGPTRNGGASAAPDAPSDLVSVIIPCYGQAHFLGEALDSVLAQSHGTFEVIVVDDGSPDDTAAVVARYAERDPRVRGFRQENRGLSGARNAGLARARGEHVVFLDADDKLCPDALASGLAALRAHPDCAFASGRFEFVEPEGRVVDNPLDIGRIDGDPYEALLRVNQIAVPAMVMYRRWVFDAVGTFDQSVSPAEDYDLYLRVTRRFPISTHDAVVAHYRQHGGGLSANASRMARALLRVMDRQLPHVARSARLRQAHREGVRFWKRFYFTRAARNAMGRVLHDGNWRPLMRDLPIVIRWGPLAVARYLPEKLRPRRSGTGGTSRGEATV